MYFPKFKLKSNLIQFLILYQSLFTFVNTFLSPCIPGVDTTNYAENLTTKIKLNNQVKLPQRYIGSVFLKYGNLENLTNINLIEKPVKVICANQSVGAIQLKLSIENVILNYNWSFSDICEGVAQTMPQTLYFDIDLEKNNVNDEIRLLGSYTSTLIDTSFNVMMEKCTYFNKKILSYQIRNVCKKAALHDVDLVLQINIKPIIFDYIEKNKFFVN